jgi:hypothetical protein
MAELTLQELYVEVLRDLFDAENRLNAQASEDAAAAPRKSRGAAAS